MSAKMKNLFLVILSCLMVFSMSLVALGSVMVKADIYPDTFTMIQGAQLRISGENIEKTNGIRFQAKIGANVVDAVKAESGAYFGMIVVPESYFDTFKDKLTPDQNGYVDYVTVFKTELEKLGYEY